MFEEGIVKIKLNVIKMMHGHDSMRILIEMHKVNQNHYVGIKDYEETLNENLNIYSLCTRCSKEESKRHLTEAFFNGLEKYTRRVMIQQT